MSYCAVITCVNRFKLVSTTYFSMMSKLARALLVFGLFAVAWVVLAWDLPGLGLTSQWLQLVWAMPAYLLVCFGCWALATVGLRLSSFRDCPEAAEELRAEVVAARMHLSTQGYRF